MSDSQLLWVLFIVGTVGAVIERCAAHWAEAKHGYSRAEIEKIVRENVKESALKDSCTFDNLQESLNRKSGGVYHS